MKRFDWRAGVAAAIALASAAPAMLRAQDRAPDAYAITNARIVTGAGTTIANGTIVIRNGLIAAVGAGITPPADARIVNATGLTVYPGLIDALSGVGMPGRGGGGGGRGGGGAPGGAPAAADPIASINSTQRPGMRPELMAADILQVDDSAFAVLRNVGFTSALTAGRSGMFLGQSALINLQASTPQEAVLRAPVALHLGFGSPGGGYPNSLMGVFASIRQIFLDAQHYRDVNALYEKNPLGIRRPTFDPSLAALQPAINGTMPVVMYVNAEREILRAIDLANEFKLKLVIGGGSEAFKVVDQIKAANASVLLTTNLPRRTGGPIAADAEPEPLEVLRDRVDAQKGASRLQQAGVRFAFHTAGLQNPADALLNVSRMMTQGLTADQALRALTMGPAEMFGVANRVGSVEAGKIANLTIASGDLFSPNTRIRYVFIDGRPTEIRATVAQAPAGRGGRAGGPPQQEQQVAAGVTGTWAMTISIGTTQNNSTLVLTQDGDRLTGTIDSELGRAAITEARINDSGNIHFRVIQTIGTQTFEGVFDGNVEGTRMTGTVQISGTGAAPFTAVRRPQTAGGIN